MSLLGFGRTLAEVVLDASILLFAAFIAFLTTFGLGLLNNPVLFFIGIIVLVFATSALLKYATIVARSLALGLLVPSAEGPIFDYFREAWAFKPWIAFVGYNAVIVAAWMYGSEQLAFVLLALTLPLLPAAVGAIAVNASLLSMFNLMGLLRLIWITGSDYLKILAIWGATAGLAYWLRGAANGFSLSYLAVFAGVMQVMTLFAASGIVLFHHNKALAIPIMRESRENRDAARTGAALEAERRTALDQAYVFFSRGNSVGGLQRIKSYLETHDDDAWEWFVMQMQSWDRPEPVLQLLQHYIGVLLRRDDQRAATRWLLWCLRADRRFMPLAPDRAQARALLEGYSEADLAAGWSQSD